MPDPQRNLVALGHQHARSIAELDARLEVFAARFESALKGLDILANLRGNSFSVTFPVAPNTDLTFNHGLGTLPQGYLVLQRNNAGVIYNGGVAWTTTQITLRSSVASTVATIFVF